MADINAKWPWPQNVGVLGTYAEEVKALQKTEKNPDAAPMPALAPTKLLTPARSSDNLRMGEPELLKEIHGDATPVPLTHVVLRRVLGRSRKKGVLKFDEAVETENLEDMPSTRREQMRSMLSREKAMLEILDRYNGLAEGVYMRLLSESKG